MAQRGRGRARKRRYGYMDENPAIVDGHALRRRRDPSPDLDSATYTQAEVEIKNGRNPYTRADFRAPSGRLIPKGTNFWKDWKLYRNEFGFRSNNIGPAHLPRSERVRAPRLLPRVRREIVAREVELAEAQDWYDNHQAEYKETNTEYRHAVTFADQARHDVEEAGLVIVGMNDRGSPIFECVNPATEAVYQHAVRDKELLAQANWNAYHELSAVSHRLNYLRQALAELRANPRYSQRIYYRENRREVIDAEAEYAAYVAEQVALGVDPATL